MDLNNAKTGVHPSRIYRMVVVGHRGVGKSAIVVRFLTKRFISEYQENSDMMCSGVVEVDNENLQLNIKDTSEKGVIAPFVDCHFQWADAVMLVYSITDEASYKKLADAISRLKEKLVAHEENEVIRLPAIVVVGNKGDLDHLRQVPRSWGYNMAEQLGCPFYETSASEGWSRIVEPPSSPTPQAVPIIHRHPRLRHVNSTELLHAESKDKSIHKSMELISPKQLTYFGKRRKSAPMGNNVLSVKNSFSNNPNTRRSLRVKDTSSSEFESDCKSDNDSNNNSPIKVRHCPPLKAVPIKHTTELHVTQNTETKFLSKSLSQSRGKKLMKRLSPRLSRKGLSTHSSDNSLPRHGESVARGLMSVGAFAFNSLGRSETMKERSRLPAVFMENTDHSTNCGQSPSKTLNNSLQVPVFGLNIYDSSSEEDSDTTIKNFQNISISGDEHTTLKTTNVKIPSVRILPATDTITITNEEVPLGENQKPLVIINKPHIQSESELTNRLLTFSEPFKYICREAKLARRSRDRSKSPSQFVRIRNGIRRIKTFASEQHNHSIKPVQNIFHAAVVRP